MDIEVVVKGGVFMDTIFDMFPERFDSIKDFEEAIRKLDEIDLTAVVSRYQMEEAASDDWVKEQYEERFPEPDYVQSIDLVAATAALAKGDHAMARTLFDRAGRPDLGSAAVGQ